MMLSEKKSQKALIISITLHALILFLFALIKLNLKIELPQFTEITFVSGTSNHFNASLAREIKQQMTPPASDEQQQESQNIIKLPVRKMAEDEEPRLRVVDRTKQTPVEESRFMPEFEKKFNDQKELPEALLTQPSAEEKEIALPSDEFNPDQKLLPSHSAATDAIGQTPYEIEGQAAKRIVTHKVIPEYPEKLQKQAIVKIRFTVLPNGHVGEMIPIIRSDDQLEKLSLDALRQWRFNPLPADQPLRTEQGIITFRYLLK